MSIINEQLCNNIIFLLNKLNIKLLAIDFDLTLISIHTGGQWNESSDNLVPYVRPFFKILIEKILKINYIFVSITTYSTQYNLISNLIKRLFPNGYDKIIIQTNSNDMHRVQNSIQAGKQQHISKVINFLYNTKQICIKPKEVLLFDDDVNNIKWAVHSHHYAMKVTKLTSLEDIILFLDHQIKKYIDGNINLSANGSSSQKSTFLNQTNSSLVPKSPFNNSTPYSTFSKSSDNSGHSLSNNIIQKDINSNSLLLIDKIPNYNNQLSYANQQPKTYMNNIKNVPLTPCYQVDHNDNNNGPLLRYPVVRKSFVNPVQCSAVPVSRENLGQPIVLFKPIINSSIQNGGCSSYVPFTNKIGHNSYFRIQSPGNFQNGTIFGTQPNFIFRVTDPKAYAAISYI